MKLLKVDYEDVKCTIEGVKYDIDRYTVVMRSPLATQEFIVRVDHIDRVLSGDVIRYGHWGYLDREEVVEFLELVEAEGKLVRPFREYI
jgi:hypothetical protein